MPSVKSLVAMFTLTIGVKSCWHQTNKLKLRKLVMLVLWCMGLNVVSNLIINVCEPNRSFTTFLLLNLRLSKVKIVFVWSTINVLMKWMILLLVEILFILFTLWCQLEDSVLLIGTLLLFDPVLFPNYEAWLLIGSIPNFEAL